MLLLDRDSIQSIKEVCFSLSHLLLSHKNLAYAVNAHTHTHHWDDITAVVRVTSSLLCSFKFQALLRKSHYFYKNMSCSCPIKENVSHKLAGSVETNEFLLKNMFPWLWGKWTKHYVLPTELQYKAATVLSSLISCKTKNGLLLSWPHSHILNQLLNRSNTTYHLIIVFFYFLKTNSSSTGTSVVEKRDILYCKL